MGFRHNMSTRISGLGDKALDQFMKRFELLEEHMITIQENQVEFEKYLQNILKNQEKILNSK